MLILKKYTVKIALVWSAFFLCIVNFHAQSAKLTLLPGTEKVVYNKSTGIHRLLGTVSFTLQGNTLFCDSALYYEKKNEVRGYGNVHIMKDGINFFCDSMYYSSKTKIAKLWGRVSARDLEYKLTTDTLEYDTKKEKAIYRYGGKITSITGVETLSSKIGYFYPKSKNLFFSQRVYYKNEDLQMTTDTLQFNYAKQKTFFYGPTKIINDETTMLCERGWFHVKTKNGCLVRKASIEDPVKFVQGDTLVYLPSQGRSVGVGNVYFKDKEQNDEFWGNYAIHDKKKRYAQLSGKALVKKCNSKDTIYIHADTIHNTLDSLGKVIRTKGYYHTQVYSKTSQARCDSLTYSKNDSLVHLYSNPVVWSENSELKGDQIDLVIVDSSLQKIHIFQNATVLMEVDSGMYYNQLGGKEIECFLHANKINEAHVIGNARTIFFPLDEGPKDSMYVVKRLGMNRLLSSELRIYLDSGEVKGITYLDKPEGVFYPMDAIDKEEQFLPNFRWKEMIRPKRWQDILNH